MNEKGNKKREKNPEKIFDLIKKLQMHVPVTIIGFHCK